MRSPRPSSSRTGPLPGHPSDEPAEEGPPPSAPARRERHEAAFFSRALGGLLILAGIGLGSLAAGPAGAVAGGLVGAAGAAGIEASRRRRDLRWRQALAAPFPKPWGEFLVAHYDHYRRLPHAQRLLFEDALRVFLAERRITGIGVDSSEELRLLVAASAVTLSLAWPLFEWDHVTEVLLYPHDFDRDYSFGKRELSGQAHAWGTVILSVPSLRKSFKGPHDGYHVGLHEFAHLLDVEHARFDGIPAGLTEAQSRRWTRLVAVETKRLLRGQSLLDPYGAENPVEFFAVSVESFFDQPQALRRRHKRLYAMLAAYFRQDPAAWDDARGLTP